MYQILDTGAAACQLSETKPPLGPETLLGDSVLGKKRPHPHGPAAATQQSTTLSTCLIDTSGISRNDRPGEGWWEEESKKIQHSNTESPRAGRQMALGLTLIICH